MKNSISNKIFAVTITSFIHSEDLPVYAYLSIIKIILFDEKDKGKEGCNFRVSKSKKCVYRGLPPINYIPITMQFTKHKIKKNFISHPMFS